MYELYITDNFDQPNAERRLVALFTNSVLAIGAFEQLCDVAFSYSYIALLKNGQGIGYTFAKREQRSSNAHVAAIAMS